MSQSQQFQLSDSTEEGRENLMGVDPYARPEALHAFAFGTLGRLREFDASATTVHAIDMVLSKLSTESHQALLNSVAEHLGIDELFFEPDSRKEIGLGVFSNPQEIHAMGSVCFLAFLISDDPIEAQKLLHTRNLSLDETQVIRRDLEGVYRKIFSDPDSPWGTLLEGLNTGIRNSIEKELILGFFHPYIALDAEAPSSFIQRVKNFIFREHEEATPLQAEFQSPYLQRAEEKFINELTEQFKSARADRSKAIEKANQLELERKRLEVAATQAQIHLETAKKETAVAERQTAETVAQVLTKAGELSELRAGNVPREMKLASIPEMVKATVAAEGSSAISECSCGKDGPYYATVSSISLTYTDPAKCSRRDQDLLFSDPAKYRELKEAWLSRCKTVLNRGLNLRIPKSLAYIVSGLEASHPLRSALSGKGESWMLSFAAHPFNLFDKDGGWGSFEIVFGRNGLLQENQYAGFDIEHPQKGQGKESVVGNIVMNLVVQAIEIADGKLVPRVP